MLNTESSIRAVRNGRKRKTQGGTKKSLTGRNGPDKVQTIQGSTGQPRTKRDGKRTEEKKNA